MIATVAAASLLGTTGQPVLVEVHVGSGLPGFQIVGLPDVACRESRDRVRAAVLSSGLSWPSNKRVTVNLAPSGVRKGGSGLDLAVAVGVLAADEHVERQAVEGVAFLAELGLDGSLRGVPGVAPMVASLDADVVVVPRSSWHEAHAVAPGRVRLAATLAEVVDALQTGRWPDLQPPPADDHRPDPPDLGDVRGQPEARMALEIAAAGGHHLLMVGPPGSGKTMIAQRIIGLLPDLDPATALEATMIHSAAGVPLPVDGVVRRPTFRAPHHSSSMVSLVGGGSSTMRPGEVSLAHGGALFLDELGEFPGSVLDALRQPLEEGVVRVTRANIHITVPARFLLVAATNPCPCGGGRPGECECDESAKARYMRRLSEPLLDRFDLRVGVQRTSVDHLVRSGGGESSAVVRQRVDRARATALARAGLLNAAIPPDRVDEFAPVSAAASDLLRRELERGRLSGRGYHRIRRVARTIADLGIEPGAPARDGDVGVPDVVDVQHVALALRFRVAVGSSARRRVA